MATTRKINGSWQLRHIIQCTDIEALQGVHAEIGRRIAELKRLRQSKALRHGDRVHFKRDGHTIAGTLYRLHTNEAWIKADDGTIYMTTQPSDLVPARGDLCHPPDTPSRSPIGREGALGGTTP